nr:hypothetical protein [Tanacetum cinerariifolium]
MSTNTKFAKQSILGKPPKVDETHAFSKPVTSNSIPTPQGSKVMKNNKVIAPVMFRINPFNPSREEKHMLNKVRASVRTKPIIVSKPSVITKKVVNSDSNGLSSTGVDNTKTRRPQPRSNTKNDMVPYTFKSSQNKNKGVEVEEHHRKLLLSRNKKHMSSACNNFTLDSQNVYSKVVYAMCKQCLISINHDVCLLNYVNDMNSRGKKQKANISLNENQKKQKPKVKKTKKVGSIERLASPKPSKPRSFLSLPKLKYHKEHLCPSCEQGKRKRTSHPPKPVSNSRQSLHLLHMDLCGPMRIASINEKRYILVIMDDYSHYTWVHFLISKDEAPENDREDIGKLGSKGDIGFFIGYSADSCAYKVFNRRTKKIMETMNVSGLDLINAPSTITSQQPTEGELDLLFEAMYDDYIGGQPSASSRTVSTTQAPQVRQTSTSSTSIADTAPTPTKSSSQATNFPITLQDNVKEAMTDPVWIESMQEELFQFKRLDVWVLVPAPDNISPLTLKWLFKNKHDEEQTVIQNKSRLVVRGYRPEEGIDFKESFASVARTEAIRIFLAYVAHKSFTVFEMDVNTAFLHGTIDPTLFIRRFDNDILVVQVYVDDIIFGSTHP